MHYSYKTRGTCSSQIDFDLSPDGTVSDIRFTGGCNGNLKAVALLSNGKSARELADLLRGNTCGPRATSCADQFSRALTEALEKMKAESAENA